MSTKTPGGTAGAGSAAEVSECVELLDQATPYLYRRNLFRVLNLPVTATAADVRRQQKRLDMQKKLGMASSADGKHPLALVPPPTDDDVRAALDRLNDPEARLMDEVFWFWPLDGDAAADIGLSAMAQGQIKGASQFWTKQAKENGHGQIATHNLAVLHHLAALDYEARLVTGDLDARYIARLAELWADALARWRDVLDGEDFWSRVKERVREMNDARLTTGLVRRMRTTLPKALLLINAGMAYSAAERKDGDGAQRHVRIVRESGFHDGLADAALREALQPLRNRLKVAIDHARGRWTESPHRASQYLRDLYSQASAVLSTVDIVLGSKSPIRLGLHDMVADAMLEGQFAFVNKTNDWLEGVRLLELAQKIAVSDVHRTRLSSHIETLRKNAELGNDWCSPGYWDLPQDVLELLESIRARVQSGSYDAAIQALLALDPRIGKPLRRCLAFSLSQRGSQIAGKGFEAFGEPTTRIVKFLAYIDRHQRISVPTPQTPSYALPECPCCGSRYYTNWAHGEYKEQRFWMCGSCSSADDVERERKKNALREALGKALAYTILADELDPGDPGIRQELGTLREIAGKINCNIPNTKALRKQLGSEKRRARHEVFRAAATDTVCYFCSRQAPDQSSQIVVPMCTGYEPVELLLGKGSEYSHGEVVVPRCAKCRDAHRNLPEQLERWADGRAAAGKPERFPQAVAAIAAAEANLHAAQEQQSRATDPRNFPQLAAEASATALAATAARATVDAARQTVADAQAGLQRAEASNGTCPQCGSDAFWIKNLCRRCDRHVLRLGFLAKCATVAITVVTFLVAFVAQRDLHFLSPLAELLAQPDGGVQTAPQYMPVVAGGAMGLFAILSAIIGMKMRQCRRRRELRQRREPLVQQQREQAVRAAESSLVQAAERLSDAEAKAQAPIAAHRAAQERLSAAQAQAASKAERTVQERIAVLERARSKIEAMRQAAVAEYETASPEPSLPPHVKAESAYSHFPRIQQLLEKHWGFGSEPGTDGRPGSAVPVNVRGLVTRVRRPARADRQPAQDRGSK